MGALLGDDYAWGIPEGDVHPNFDWWRVADNPDEVRRRFTAEWTPFGPTRADIATAEVRLSGTSTSPASTTSDESRAATSSPRSGSAITW